MHIIWRRERDSNPRYGFPYTHFPGVRLQPLGHPSLVWVRRTKVRVPHPVRTLKSLQMPDNPRRRATIVRRPASARRPWRCRQAIADELETQVSVLTKRGPCGPSLRPQGAAHRPWEGAMRVAATRLNVHLLFLIKAARHDALAPRPNAVSFEYICSAIGFVAPECA